MLFNSWKFLIFFPAVFAVYFLLGARYRWMFLLAASVLFYLAFNPYHILIIGLMIGVNYGIALFMESAGDGRKMYLISGLIANCLFLFVFKYFNFFMDNVSALTTFFNIQVSAAIVKIIIPVGISYVTFQLISYLLEVHRGAQKAERHFGIFALYVLFFPKVCSGPIERPQDLIHQFYEPHGLDPDRISAGLKLMAWGFLKKVVIADRLAIVVNHVYGDLGSYTGFPLIVAAVFFTFQLYCDFSGYTDIAVGSARILGFNLTPNFDRPFFATSLTDFWRRWHITLSSWLRDYLYTPIALNRRYWGRAGIVFALMVTFTVCGLWHGSSWNFVLFGVFNGIGLSLDFLIQKKRSKLEKKAPAFISNAINIFVTFMYFTFTLIFFRAITVADSWYVLTHLFSGFGTSVLLFSKINMGLSNFEFKLAVISIIVITLIEFMERRGAIWELVLKKPSWVRWGVYYLMLLSIALLGVYSSKAQFIYFQF